MYNTHAEKYTLAPCANRTGAYPERSIIMKKIALLLALLMVLSVAVLASCGKNPEDSKPEESAAESKPAEESKPEESAAESQPAAESEDEESKPAEESVDEESKPEESKPEESKDEQPVLEGNNLALNKSYVISGCGEGFSDGANIYQANLTDGAAYEQLTYSNTNNWFGFYSSDKGSPSVVSAPGSVGTVVIDLGASGTFGKVRVHLSAAGGASGIGTPKSIEVEASEDGNTYNEFGATQIDDSASNAVWIEVDGSATGRYVRVTINMDPTCVFAFLNEIEVIG